MDKATHRAPVDHDWTAVGWLVAHKKSPQHARRPALQVNIGIDGTRISYTAGVMDDDDMFQGYKHISHSFAGIYGTLLADACLKVEQILATRPADLKAALRAVFKVGAVK